jgi:hypothetical protein
MDPFVGEVRKRIRYLLCAGMLAVALVFGLTFYFALIANQSALARQVPELEAIAAKMKGLLMVNTLVFVAIIVLSFLALSSIVTARFFQSLALVHRDLKTIAAGKLPKPTDRSERGPFAELDVALAAIVSSLRDRERKEIEELTRCCEALSRSASAQGTVRKLMDLVAAKRAFTGCGEAPSEKKDADAKTDPLFIQPL